ncbi:hydroxyethylthiazole kinase [Sporosarcina sp. HYO08]|uniref:hydroxyethylthiazole kinase n=1 Tax=Sporosarcina sp. HYO08 TaxID=1759557 RepID=UPI0007942847|nr:hydroxyethylthiazole kinase [Sporosarcina sp. HYO08]KXH79737.1 hydroxyethylthiazole kinase [Sporosarcina sp. HYO08]
MTNLNDIKQKNPLIHCLTNIVVANFQANGLLALGASPIMADSIEEAAEVAAFSSAVLVNIGTLDPASVDAMIAAGKSANEHGKPLVLDPVGVGATAFRKRTVEKMLGELKVTLIRGNAAEIAAIAGVEWSSKGVDAGDGTANLDVAAQKVAKQYGCIVAVTGETDIVTDGVQLIRITGGHPLMSRVTGTGCLLSAVSAAFLAVGNDRPLEAVAESLAFYKKAGEIAAGEAKGPGDFEVQFLNALYTLNENTFANIKQTRIGEKVT